MLFPSNEFFALDFHNDRLMYLYEYLLLDWVLATDAKFWFLYEAGNHTHFRIKSLFCRQQSKRISYKLRIIGHLWGNSHMAGGFPQKRPVMRKAFSCHEVIVGFLIAASGGTLITKSHHLSILQWHLSHSAKTQNTDLNTSKETTYFRFIGSRNH